jgi:hypothetical protein
MYSRPFRPRGFGRGKIATGAGFVFDNHWLPERGFQVLGQEPCRKIGAPARWKRHKNDDRPGGPILCEGRRG